MQNISTVLCDLGMPWISGYLPAKNVGSAVKGKIAAVLRLKGIDFLAPYVTTSDQGTLAVRVSALRKHRMGKMPIGNTTPGITISSTTTFVRDPAVKAWILQAANGMCEGCGLPAPFLAQDGLPYLEVHHVVPLSQQGSDRITNAAALCPNCHRRCHFSVDRDEFRRALYREIPRLIREFSNDIHMETDEFVPIA
jgi:5-methylcytosine-specific restriction protein A